jgi:uncharacterized ferredoxin-like protein
MRRQGELETSAVVDVAALMASGARTAPKTRGIDNVEISVIDDSQTRTKLIEKMKEISKKENRPSLERDACSIASAPAIVLIGVKPVPSGLNCGFCGYKTCEELRKVSGICAYNSIDLGLAVGSAIGIASQFHIDNRVMYSIGRAAMDLGLFEKDIRQALGIPLSATGKNPFFDRK